MKIHFGIRVYIFVLTYERARVTSQLAVTNCALISYHELPRSGHIYIYICAIILYEAYFICITPF